MQLFLDDGHQNVDGNGSPDLGFDLVLRGALEAFDAQMLFISLKNSSTCQRLF